MFDFVCCDASGVSITNLYQWDIGIYLYIPDWDKGIPAVHFCNKNSEAVIPMPSVVEDGKLKVKIPNILLQEASTLFAYFYLGDTDGGMRTVHAVQIPVRKRLKPEDYEYEEDGDSGLVLTEAILGIDKRISDLIKAMSESGGGGGQVSNVEIIDARIPYDGSEPYPLVGDHIRQIARDLDIAKVELKKYAESVSNIAGLKYEDNVLSLVDADGKEVGDPVTITGGGGGGGSSDAIWKVRNAMDGTAFTMPMGTHVILQFTYQSVEDGDPNGGSAEVYVNGAKRGTIPINQPTESAVTVNADVTKYLSAGTSTVRLRVSDGTNVKNLNYTIELVDLSIASTFDETKVYTGDVEVRYTPYGAIDKNVIFELDGNQIASIPNNTTNKQSLYTIPASSFSHGSHTLRIWMEATLNGSEITSNVLSYGIVYDAGSDRIIIASGFDRTEATEGDVITIPYFIYTPGLLKSTATLTIKNPDGSVFSSTPLEEVERKQYYWTNRKYPTGNGVKFIISSGSGSNAASKEFTMNISESEVQIDVVDPDGSEGSLKLRLSALGKGNSDAGKETWVEEISNKNVATMSMFNYQTNGWIDDALEVSGNATVALDLKLFGTDFKQNGRTIEIEFETKDVKNADTVIFECKSGNVGIIATPQQFTFSGSTTSVSVKYREEERIRIGIVVEPTNGNEQMSQNKARLIHLYVNGVDSGVVQYSKNENFEQGVVKQLTIGSTECTTRVYSILQYNVALTRYQMLNNYMADRDTLEEKKDIRDRNAIYDDYDEIVFDLLNGQIPCMILTGNLPQFKGDKVWMDVDYTDVNNPENDFHWKNALVDVQGTSSQYYPRKNYKIKSVKEKKDAKKVVRTTTDEDNNQKPKYCLNPDYILPCTDFCVKADFAESSGTHNTGLAKLIPSLYTVKTPPQSSDNLIRTTIYGFPICIFHRQTENDTPVFIGKYNFNSDKGSENTFGFDKDTYPNCECWEIKNNYSMRNVWLSDKFTDDDLIGKVTDDFERRFPDEDDEEYPVSYSQLQRLSSWLASTAVETEYDEIYEGHVSKPTGNALPSGGNNYGYTNDTREYRLAKFKAEFEQYFNKDYCLVYYLCALFFAMADSRAKNMMLATWDGTHWFPIFYDMDTVLGINNQGEIAYKYNVEFKDVVAAQDAFNGKLSVLWNNFGECFADDIKEKYNQIRQANNIFNFNVFMKYFEEQQADMWCESVYNEDGNAKYIVPAVEGAEYTNPDDTEGAKIPAAQFLVDLQGSRKSHRYWWLKNRLSYIDSKYQAYGITTDTLTMRVNFPTVWSGVKPSSVFNVVPYIDMYCWARYGASSTPVGERGYQNEVCTIDPNKNVNNLETALFGASLLSDIGDISDKYAGTIDVSKAIRLSRLIVGSNKNGYANPNLTNLTIGTNKLLREVNIQNCSALVNPLDVSKCENIQKIYAKGAGISGIDLPDSGYITDLELPANMADFFIYNQKYVENFSIEGTDRLERVMIQNCRGIPSAGIVSYAPNIKWINLTDVDWTANGDGALTNSRALRKLLTIEKGLSKTNAGVVNTEDPVASGVVYCQTNATDIKAALASKFPELQITWGSATEYKVEFKVTEADGTVRVVDTEYVASGGSVVDPTQRDISPIKVTKAEADGIAYVFTGWDKTFDNITGNTVVNAVFAEEVAMANVTWVDPYGAEGYQVAERPVRLNTKASPMLFPKKTIFTKIVTEVDSDTGETIEKEVVVNTEEAGAIERVFAGWQSSDSTLELDDYTVTDTDVQFTAIYKTVALPENFATTTTTTTTLDDLEWYEIRALCKDSLTTIETDEDNNKWLAYDGNRLFTTKDTKKITLSNGWVVVWEIADFEKDFIYDEDTGEVTSTKAKINWAMKYAYTTSVAQNSSTRMCFDYTLGTTRYKAYEDGYNYTTNSDYKHKSSAEYVKMSFNDFSYISSIKVTKQSGNTITWYFDSTATDTSNEAALKYGARTPTSSDADGFKANKVRNAEFDFHGMICYAPSTDDWGDILINYNNDSNSESTTAQVEFQAGSYVKIPVENGDTVTITHCATYNNGGYFYGGYRSWVNNTFIPLFPRVFRNSVRVPNNLVNLGLYSKTLIPFHDILYPFSPVEVGYSTNLVYQLRQGTRKLVIFDSNTNRIKYKADKNGDQTGSAQPWWLRTSYAGQFRSGGNHMFHVFESGNIYDGTGSAHILCRAWLYYLTRQ